MIVLRVVVLGIHTETVAAGSCPRMSIEHCSALAGRLSAEEATEERVAGDPIHFRIGEAVVVVVDSPTFWYKLE